MRNSLKGVEKSRDVYDTLGPLYFLTLIVGISPFKWTSHKYQSSKIAVIYSFTLLISFLAAYNFRVSYKVEEEKFSISSLSDKIKTYSNNGLATVLIVMSYWKSKDIIDLTKQIAEFDEIITKQILHKIDYVTSKLLICGYSLFVIIMSGILENFYCSMSLVQRILYSNTCWVYCYFSIILSATLEFQFITYVLIIQDRFKLLNKQLMNMHAENETVEPTNITPDQNADLRILQQCHIRLSELCKYINDLFSFQMLLCITLLFVHIMIYIVQAIHKYLMNEIDANMNIFIAYIIYYLIRLLLVTKSCDSTINEGKKTGHLLHGVDPNLDDEVITNEFQVLMFSKQLIHNKLKFTAYGFFTIDMTLFFTVIAAIVTYLLVLIQMDIPFSAGITKNNTVINS